MNWFTRLCRQTGLMMHNVIHPNQRTVVNRTVEEKKLNQTTTLRRTTIEEIEIKTDLNENNETSRS